MYVLCVCVCVCSRPAVRGATPTQEDVRVHRCEVGRRKEYCVQS